MRDDRFRPCEIADLSDGSLLNEPPVDIVPRRLAQPLAHSQPSFDGDIAAIVCFGLGFVLSLFEIGHENGTHQVATVLVTLVRPAPYSTTSVALTMSSKGTDNPSARAVLRLIAKSNCVGSSIGKSAAFAPFSIFPT